ncbi:MAG: hypothetical protein R2793_09650 [Flavobacteriaceae bacterium]
MAKESNSIKRWAVLSGIAIQMGVIIYLLCVLVAGRKYTENAYVSPFNYLYFIKVSASLFLV